MDKYIEKLKFDYQETISLISSIDENVKYVNVSEVGFFIGSIASLKLFGPNENVELADKFNSKWLDYICNYYEKHSNKKIKKESLIPILRDRYPIYSKLFLEIIDQINRNNDEKIHNASVQLTWEIFSNSTGKTKPDDFLNLTFSSPYIMEIALKVFHGIEK